MSQKDEVTETEEVEEVEESPEEESPDVKEPDEFEPRAKRMGWVPEDQFRGEKSRWVDAKTFVEKGENELPILRERLRRADEGLKELGEVKETLKNFQGYMTKVEERAFVRAKAEIESKRQEAKEAGDFDKYERASTELQKLETEAKPKEPEKKSDPMTDPVFAKWVGENDWMRNDPERSVYAETYGAFLNRTKPELKGEAFLENVEEAVKKQFPEKFENPRRNNVARVEGSGTPQQRKTGGKSYADLPPEAKKECDRYIKQELLTKDQYVKDYFEG